MPFIAMIYIDFQRYSLKCVSVGIFPTALRDIFLEATRNALANSSLLSISSMMQHRNICLQKWPKTQIRDFDVRIPHTLTPLGNLKTNHNLAQILPHYFYYIVTTFPYYSKWIKKIIIFHHYNHSTLMNKSTGLANIMLFAKPAC